MPAARGCKHGPASLPRARVLDPLAAPSPQQSAPSRVGAPHPVLPAPGLRQRQPPHARHGPAPRPPRPLPSVGALAPAPDLAARQQPPAPAPRDRRRPRPTWPFAAPTPSLQPQRSADLATTCPPPRLPWRTRAPRGAPARRGPELHTRVGIVACALCYSDASGIVRGRGAIERGGANVRVRDGGHAPSAAARRAVAWAASRSNPRATSSASAATAAMGRGGTYGRQSARWLCVIGRAGG